MGLSNKLDGIKKLWQFDNRWQLILARLFFPREKLNTYRYKGLEVLVDHVVGDASIARDVLATPMYRQYLDEMNLPPKLNILDLGANIGCFPLLLRSEEFHFNKLACVELNPKTFSRLRFNMERNLGGQAQLLNGALCGKSGPVEITLGEGGAFDSIYRGEPGGNTYQLSGYTFDEIYQRFFGEEDVDICKIDVEYAEFEVFANPGHDLIKKCRNILIEIHHEKDKPRDIVRNKITALGFREIDPDSKEHPINHYVHFFSRQS
jgi:FkbM family methyltransferase